MSSSRLVHLLLQESEADALTPAEILIIFLWNHDLAIQDLVSVSSKVSNDVICTFRWCGGVAALVSAIVIPQVLLLHNNHLIISMRLYTGSDSVFCNSTVLAACDCVGRDCTALDEVEATVGRDKRRIKPVELNASTLTRPRVSVPQAADYYHRLIIEVGDSGLSEDVLEFTDGDIVDENPVHDPHQNQTSHQPQVSIERHVQKLIGQDSKHLTNNHNIGECITRRPKLVKHT